LRWQGHRRLRLGCGGSLQYRRRILRMCQADTLSDCWRATVLPGSRRLSSCLPFLLRFIFLERERGKRWWRVSRSSPMSLPHSWHLPAVLCPEYSSLGAFPTLYGRLRERLGISSARQNIVTTGLLL
jgi:hypothetical protein